MGPDNNKRRDRGHAPDLTSEHVQRAVAGHPESLEWVVARFSPLLKAQARYRMGSALEHTVEVEDIVAEAWLVALRRLEDLIQKDGRHTPRLLAFLSTTIIRIVNRAFDDHIRKKKYGQGAGDVSQRDGLLDRQEALITGVVTHAVRGDLSAAIDAAMGELTKSDRHVIVLRGIEGLPNQEVAATLGESPDTVSHRYRRALQRLREALPSSVFDELADG